MASFHPMNPVPSARGPLRIVSGKSDAEQDDRELVRALVRGESWAATATWNKHSPMVFGFLRRAFGPDIEVEDLTQDVFLRVFSKVRELRDEGALRSFIFSIAVRASKWEMRRRKVRSILHFRSSEEMEQASVPGLDPESREALRRFYAILDLLGTQERAAFALRHMEGMKLEEIADALGISLATVKRRLERATRVVERCVGADPQLAAYRKAVAS
jgi:RNA polymerase sigma-70 factor (ECF subfamily)